jgi:phosphinothricin acetyltransferase
LCIFRTGTRGDAGRESGRRRPPPAGARGSTASRWAALTPASSTSPRATTRPAALADAAAVAAIHNQGIEERIATFETEPRTVESVAERISEGELMLVAERNREVVGFASVSPYSMRAVYATVGEVSVYVDRGARGSGVGSLLIEAIAAAAADRGLHKVVGRLFTTNEASIAMFRGNGFREVGVHRRHSRLDGEWRDVLLIERLVGEAADH